MQRLRLCYLLQVQADGTRITRTSLIPAMLGSVAAESLVMVLVQACSAFTATLVAATLATRLVPPWFQFHHRILNKKYCKGYRKNSIAFNFILKKEVIYKYFYNNYIEGNKKGRHDENN